MLESFATKARDKAAALKFSKKLMKRHGCARTIATDGLRFYKAAMNEVGIADRQEVGRWANDRAENAHQPFRRPERAMLQFRQMKSLQKFASVHASFHNYFKLTHHLISCNDYQDRRSAAMAEWENIAARAMPLLGGLRHSQTCSSWTDSTPVRYYPKGDISFE